MASLNSTAAIPAHGIDITLFAARPAAQRRSGEDRQGAREAAVLFRRITRRWNVMP
jgi:hypothetical protein